MTATAATALLDSLAEALAEEGFASAPHYADSPAALLVWLPDRPAQPAESITILVGALTRPPVRPARRPSVPLTAIGEELTALI